MKKKNTIKEFLPWIIALFLAPSLKDEILIAIFSIFLIIFGFYLVKKKGELLFFTLGVLFGFAVELGGDLVYQLQYWEQGSLFGIPLWLPLYWGICFIVIHRLGRRMVKN